MSSLRTDDLLLEVYEAAALTDPFAEPRLVAEVPSVGALVVEVYGHQRDDVRPGAPVVLTDAPVILVDATAGSLFRVTLAGDRLLANPTSPSDGQMLMFEITQGAGGNHTLSLDTKYHFGTDLISVTLSTAAGKTDRLLAQYVQSRDQWDVIGFKKGW